MKRAVLIGFLFLLTVLTGTIHAGSPDERVYKDGRVDFNALLSSGCHDYVKTKSTWPRDLSCVFYLNNPDYKKFFRPRDIINIADVLGGGYCGNVYALTYIDDIQTHTITLNFRGIRLTFDYELDYRVGPEPIPRDMIPYFRLGAVRKARRLCLGMPVIKPECEDPTLHSLKLLSVEGLEALISRRDLLSYSSRLDVKIPERISAMKLLKKMVDFDLTLQAVLDAARARDNNIARFGRNIENEYSLTSYYILETCYLYNIALRYPESFLRFVIYLYETDPVLSWSPPIYGPLYRSTGGYFH